MTKPNKPNGATGLKQSRQAEQPQRKTKGSPRKTWLVLLPRHTPSLGLMLADIGSPDVAEIAKTFGVHQRTAARWLSVGRAPRPVMLALFYATQWGRSDVNCKAVNDARLYFGYAASLKTLLEEANAKLARLGQIGEFGSANDPAPGVHAELQSTPPRPDTPRKKTPSEARAALAEKRLAKRASGPPKPFDFLRTG